MEGMKKIVWVFLLLPLCLSMHAQGPHEIQLSMSSLPDSYTSSIIDLYDSSYSTDLAGLYEEREWAEPGPVLQVGYAYKVRSWLQLGVEATWSYLVIDRRHSLASGSREIDSVHQNIVSLMPGISLFALDLAHVKLYGKVAGGGLVSVGDYDGFAFRPAWQVMPLGVQWGGERVFALAEAGVGNVYNFRLGVGIRW